MSFCLVGVTVLVGVLWEQADQLNWGEIRPGLPTRKKIKSPEFAQIGPNIEVKLLDKKTQFYSKTLHSNILKKFPN